MVGFNDGFYQAQSKAEAALGTALVAAVKPLPDARLFVGGMPMPVSRIRTVTRPDSTAQERRTLPPSGVYLSALSRRFAKAWRIRVASTGFARCAEVSGDGDTLFLRDEFIEFTYEN